MKISLQKWKPSELLRRLLASWLFIAAASYIDKPWALDELSGLQALPFFLFCFRIFLLFLVLTIVSKLVGSGKWERWILPISFAALWESSLLTSFRLSYLGAGILIFSIMILYALKGNLCHTQQNTIQAHSRLWLWLATAAAVVFFAFVCTWTVGRVLTYSSPTYDFGIFSQMFHSMRTTGLPNTTLERDGLLSHFHIHVSPIYYLLLPFYCLVPTPATLQVLQAALLASAVVPLWKLARFHGFGGPGSLCICLLLLLFPAYSGGTGYDIHENAFLTPLLLWLFFGLDSKNNWITAIAAILTLTVKEDAAVYVAVIGLWSMIQALTGHPEPRHQLITGTMLLLGGILWFLWVTEYLARGGYGVMTYRYSNFMYDGSNSLITVIKAVLLCPAKALFECVDPEKLPFIGSMLPLFGLSLVTRHYDRLVLLIPFLLVNLMSDYQYQHDIFFQYTFGSTAFLVYLTLVNLADLKAYPRSLLLAAALVLTVGLFTSQVLPKASHYTKQYRQYQSYYTSVAQVLGTVPEETSVAATTFFTAPLSQRDTVYDVDYASKEHTLSCEYIVINPKASFKKYGGYQRFLDVLKEAGYVLEAQYSNAIQIFRRAPASQTGLP